LSIDKILLLGDERLYKTSGDVDFSELNDFLPEINELHKTVVDYRNKYGAGRAIAAPQLGLKKNYLF